MRWCCSAYHSPVYLYGGELLHEGAELRGVVKENEVYINRIIDKSIRIQNRGNHMASSVLR